MRIVLICPYPDITAYGPRVMAAVLRRKGHDVRMIFLPAPEAEEKPTQTPYTAEALAELAALCAGSGAVCLSLMTNYFDHAAQISRHLRNAGNVPIIWGGIHPTIRPEECLEHADFVCVGEGEDSLAELAERLEAGRDATDVPGMWCRSGETVLRNQPRPPECDLDRFPAPDYGPEGHFVLEDGHIHPMTTERLRRFLARGSVSALYGRVGYQTLAGRGCPHRCTYCGNDALRRILGGGGGVRWRSAGHVMDELKNAQRAMPFLEFIWFSDDALLSMGTERLRQFFELYVKDVGLPFACLTSPLTLSAEKLDILVRSGLFSLQMGVQTGSARIQALYNRSAMTNERMLDAMRLINRHRDVLEPPLYDFIIDAPFETAEDKRQTLLFISRMPKPFRLQPFTLVLYPGTALHDLAVEQGHVSDASRDIYRKSYTDRKPGYHTLLLLLAKNGKFPGPLLRVLAGRPVSALLGSPLLKPLYEWLFRLRRRGRAGI